ncbi:MAG: MgtC/SapB family protein [Limisphaerales bacterium]
MPLAEAPGPFLDLGVAVGLGLLVGLQRQRAGSPVAGIRTFALLALYGALSALAARALGGWVLAAAFLPVAALAVAARLGECRTEGGDVGLTTEVALLAVFVIGALPILGQREAATVAGATVAVLLHLKPQLHALAGRFAERDFTAIMQFVVVALVVLPLLPDRSFGPYDAVNPRKVWLLVVLITGLSLAGYIAFKFVGARAGAVASGILGGLVSSTATTVGFARRTKDAPGLAPLAVLVMALAAGVLVVRVALLLRVTAPGLFAAALGPLAVWLAVLAVLVVVLARRAPRQAVAGADLGNPSELRAALAFAGLYLAVLMAVAWAKERFGTAGLFVVAVLSGLTDMDAITLSLGRMTQKAQLPPDTAWRLVFTAAVSNTVFKAGMAVALGHRALRGPALAAFGVIGASAALLAWLWPA